MDAKKLQHELLPENVQKKLEKIHGHELTSILSGKYRAKIV
jgi:hypothetical protein